MGGQARLGLRLGLAAALTLAATATFSADPPAAAGFLGWPSAGLALAAFVVVPSTWRPLVLAAFMLACGPVIAQALDLSLLRGVLGSAVIAVPGWIAAHLLCGTGHSPVAMSSRADLDRWHLVATGAALLTGLGTFALALDVVPAGSAAWVGVGALAWALSSHLVVVPLLFALPARPSEERHVRQVVQVVSTAALSAVVLVWADLPVLLMLLLPMLGWAGLRLPLLAGTSQVFAVSFTAYCAAATGHGPITADALGIPAAFVPLVFFSFALCCGFLVVPVAVTVVAMLDARQRAVRAAATLDRLIESATGTYLVATDPQGRITRFNQAAAETLGWEEDEVLGRSPALFHPASEIARHGMFAGVPEGDHAAVSAALAELGVRRHWAFVRRDGSSGVITVQVSPVRDEQGRVIGYITAGEDSTERQRAHAAMTSALSREQAAAQRLVEADAVKHELVTTVSHELRTPITSILGYAEILECGDMGGLSTHQTDALGRIRRNAERLERLVADLLTLSRAETGQLEVGRATADLAGIAEEAIDELRADADAAGVAVYADLDECPVSGDAQALRRVVRGLVGNALKFTEAGGLVSIVVRSSLTGEAELLVRDTGIGMCEQDRERLFTEFCRGGAAADQALQGVGVGLTVAHALVAAHGGQLQVASEVGEGTTVTVRLPA